MTRIHMRYLPQSICYLTFLNPIFFFRSLAPLSTQKVSYVSFENIDNLEVYLTDLDSGDKTVVTEDIDFLSLGLLESHGLNITNSKSEISNSALVNSIFSFAK